LLFITGISSFSKAGLFSGLNNLCVTNLKVEYSTICGYTDHEIDTYCREHIELWAQHSRTSYEGLRQHLREWYDGYLFAADAPPVYHPFSIMNFLRDGEFENFWFQSGSPQFLIKELQRRWDEEHNFDLFDPAVNPQSCRVTKYDLGMFDIRAIEIA